VIAGEEPWQLEPAPLAGLRLGVPANDKLHRRDATVTAAFAAGLDTIGKAGARVSELPFRLLDEMIAANAKGGVLLPEVYAIHRERFAARGSEVDSHVRLGIERGATITAADYIDSMQNRARLVRAADAWLAATGLDALVMPTTSIVAPRLDELTTPDVRLAIGLALHSNTAIVNFFDLSAISIPLPRDGELPVGLMLIVRNGEDRRLFRIAAAIERLFA
jgi:aspartyl-tRNA(Asn)/glutamyl-tRNA(Gln) amidotransferase subunit A